MLSILQEKDFSNIFQKSSRPIEPDHASQLQVVFFFYNHFKCALNLLLSVNKTRMRPENSQWSILSFCVISGYFSGSNHKLSVASIYKLFFFPFFSLLLWFHPKFSWKLQFACSSGGQSRIGVWLSAAASQQHSLSCDNASTADVPAYFVFCCFFLIQARILKNA